MDNMAFYFYLSSPFFVRSLVSPSISFSLSFSFCRSERKNNNAHVSNPFVGEKRREHASRPGGKIRYIPFWSRQILGEVKLSEQKLLFYWIETPRSWIWQRNRQGKAGHSLTSVVPTLEPIEYMRLEKSNYPARENEDDRLPSCK